MSSPRPARRQRSSAGIPPERSSARQQRIARREANRALAPGTREPSGHGGLVRWTVSAFVLGLIVVAAAVYLSAPKTSPSSNGVLTPSVVTPSSITSNGRTLGRTDAPVTIDLYGDFRCSACFGFTTGGTEASLVANYVAPGTAKLVWHDYLVIDKIKHETASRDAANAAWCAADQGKFWTMHDWLYANQSPTEDASAFSAERLTAIGRAAGLDMSSYSACLANGTHDAAIATEDAGTPSSVGGTPTIFVNGAMVGSPGPVPSFSQIAAAIDAARASASSAASPSPR